MNKFATDKKKIFISADIEGVCDVTCWDETEHGNKGYEQAARQMSLEVASACKAAISKGYHVVVKDAHNDALNIDHNLLPEGVELIRGWLSDPMSMMGGLDETFDAVAFVGYHSGAGHNDNPLSHTMNATLYNWIKINGKLASEFTFNSLMAADMGIPTVFMSGDEGICLEAERDFPGITSVATKKGIGNGTWNHHPQTVLELIEAGMTETLEKNHDSPTVPENFVVEINYKDHQKARAGAAMGRVDKVDDFTIKYTVDTVRELIELFDIL